MTYEPYEKSKFRTVENDLIFCSLLNKHILLTQFSSLFDRNSATQLFYLNYKLYQELPAIESSSKFELIKVLRKNGKWVPKAKGQMVGSVERCCLDGRHGLSK